MPSRRSKRGPKALDNRGQGATSKPLKGGLGDSTGPMGWDESLAEQAKRYEVNLPAAIQTLGRQMGRGGDTRTQIASALLSAAYQHRRLPDAGSNLYGRAFQLLGERLDKDGNLIGPRLQQDLLSVLTPEEASFVNETFQNAVPEAQAPAPAIEAPARASRPEDRAREAARSALSEVYSGLDQTATVDTDQFTTPDAPEKPALPIQRGDTVVTVEDASAREWNKNQIARGWRRVVNVSPGRAPQPVLEVLASRAGDFADGPQATPGRIPNPRLGQERVTLSPRRDAATAPMTVSRVTPSRLEELTPQAQAAAATGAEKLAIYNRYRDEIPGFEDSPEGRRMEREIASLIEEHPEAADFMDNPGVDVLPLPKDPEVPATGRDALPREMRLGYFIGEAASSAPHKLEKRADRRDTIRLGNGKILRIPADAPNRQGWIEAMTFTKQVKETTKGKDGKPVTKTVTKRFLRPNAENLGPGVMGEVGLPFSDEISKRNLDYRADEYYQTDFEGRSQSESLSDWRDKAAAAEAQPALPVDPDSIATESDLEMAWDASTGKEVSRFSDDPNAKPVEDVSMTKEAWETGEGPSRVLAKGTATGSPRRVQSDRDFALREGKSALEKWQEKIWRMASEYSDPENVTTARRYGETESAGIDLSQDDGAGFGQSAIYEATGGGGDIPKRSSSFTSKKPDFEVLPLDNLVPIWRAMIEDVNEYGKATFRRPSAYEVASFLVDRIEIPDPALATRLVPIVQRSMDALEGVAPSGKSKKIAGKPYPASQARSRDLFGDSQKVYTAPAQKLLADWEAKQADAAADGWAAGGESVEPGLSDPDAPDAGAPTEALEGWTAGTDGETGTATGTPVQASPDNPFTALANKARKGTGDATNIGGLLALLTAASQMGGSEAQASELPPVEYLAMGRKPMTAKQIAARAAAAQQARGATQLLNAAQQHRAAATAVVNPPPPAATPAVVTPPPVVPAPAPAAGGAGGGVGAPPPAAPAAASPAPQPNRRPKAAAKKQTKAPSAFSRSYTGRAISGIGKAAKSYAPTLIDLATGSTILGAGYMASPYIADKFQSANDYWFPDNQSPQSQPPGSSDTLFEELYQAMPQDDPAATPSMDGSTSSIPALLQMLQRKPMV